MTGSAGGLQAPGPSVDPLPDQYQDTQPSQGQVVEGRSQAPLAGELAEETGQEVTQIADNEEGVDTVVEDPLPPALPADQTKDNCQLLCQTQAQDVLADKGDDVDEAGGEDGDDCDGAEEEVCLPLGREELDQDLQPSSSHQISHEEMDANPLQASDASSRKKKIA